MKKVLLLDQQQLKDLVVNIVSLNQSLNQFKHEFDNFRAANNGSRAHTSKLDIKLSNIKL